MSRFGPLAALGLAMSAVAADAQPPPAGRNHSEWPPEVRAERCANNRARIAELEGDLLPVGYSDEQIAHARAEVRWITSMMQRLENWSRVDRRAPRDLSRDEVERLRTEYNINLATLAPREAEQKMAEAVRMMNEAIARADALLPRRDAILREIAGFRSNLVAYGCNDLVLPGLDGTYTDGTATFTVSRNAAGISARTEAGNVPNPSHMDISGCRPEGGALRCRGNGAYRDADKEGTFQADVTVTGDAQQVSYQGRIVSSSITWHRPAYATWMDPGRTWSWSGRRRN